MIANSKLYRSSPNPIIHFLVYGVLRQGTLVLAGLGKELFLQELKEKISSIPTRQMRMEVIPDSSSRRKEDGESGFRGMKGNTK
jgi:hypothetical protein